MNKLLVVALMVGMSGAAFASQGGEGSNTNCNGVGNVNSPCAGGSVTNPVTNQGGSSAANSAAAATARATGGSAKATATGGTATATGGRGGKGGNVTINMSAAEAASASPSSTNVSNTNTYEAAASTAYAPALTSGMDTCMGSSSVGGSGVGFGFSVGTTWTDDNCVRLKNAREMAAMGYKNVAVAMMCQDAKVREAAESIGSNVCGVKPKASSDGTGPDVTDPYIQMRMKGN